MMYTKIDKDGAIRTFSPLPFEGSVPIRIPDEPPYAELGIYALDGDSITIHRTNMDRFIRDSNGAMGLFIEKLVRLDKAVTDIILKGGVQYDPVFSVQDTAGGIDNGGTETI